MRTHSGEHPRLGATDVLPFVPLGDVSMDDCIRIAHEAGTTIARELLIPVYYYERAALRPERGIWKTCVVERWNCSANRSPPIPNEHQTRGWPRFTNPLARLLLAHGHS